MPEVDNVIATASRLVSPRRRSIPCSPCLLVNQSTRASQAIQKAASVPGPTDPCAHHLAHRIGRSLTGIPDIHCQYYCQHDGRARPAATRARERTHLEGDNRLVAGGSSPSAGRCTTIPQVPQRVPGTSAAHDSPRRRRRPHHAGRSARRRERHGAENRRRRRRRTPFRRACRPRLCAFHTQTSPDQGTAQRSQRSGALCFAERGAILARSRLDEPSGALGRFERGAAVRRRGGRRASEAPGVKGEEGGRGEGGTARCGPGVTLVCGEGCRGPLSSSAVVKVRQTLFPP